MAEPNDQDYADQLKAEEREAAKAGIHERWAVERHSNDDGSIAYEIWSANMRHRVCRICDDDNPAALRDAEHIVKIHNAMFDQKPATVA